MHEYYTPKSTEFQAILYIFTIFVDYADFYVNIVMSTQATNVTDGFTIFDDFPRCRGNIFLATQNIVHARVLSYRAGQVNEAYPPCPFVQL